MSDTTYKLPIWRTARDTYALIFANFGFLIRRGWPWMLLAMVLLVGFDWAKFQFAAQDGKSSSAFRDLTTSMIQTVFQVASLAPLAVQWHRHVLHASESTMPLARVILAYGIAALAIEVFFTNLITAPVSWLTDGNTSTIDVILQLAVIILIILFCTYVWGRVMLALPAISLERDYSVRTIWTASVGNGWRLFFGSLLTTVPPLVPVLCFFLAKWGGQSGTTGNAAEPAPPIQWNWYDQIESILWFIPFAIIAISFLSVAYRELVLKREAAEQPTP